MSALLPAHRHEEAHQHEADAHEDVDVTVRQTGDREATAGDVGDDDDDQAEHGEADHDGNPPARGLFGGRGLAVLLGVLLGNPALNDLLALLRFGHRSSFYAERTPKSYTDKRKNGNHPQG